MKVIYRIEQFLMNIMAHFIKIPIPLVTKGQGCIEQIGDLLNSQHKKKVFLCVDNIFLKTHQIDNLLLSLDHQHISYVIFSHVDPNPTIENIADGEKIYLNNQCDSIVALGGGSIMDASKIIGARITNHKKVSKMKGLLKLHHRLPLLIACPTTCGTGSETTIAAVIRDVHSNQKFAINDPFLVPKYAFLDVNLLKNLPPHLVAYTGMDALTHALEAYLNKYNSSYTYSLEFEAIKLIFANIYDAYAHPDHLQAKENMMHASFLAGLAFTRKYVGYVHAIAHAIGGFYNTQHGYTNALLLPIVLEAYGSSIDKKMAKLYDFLYGPSTDSNHQKCVYLIKIIRKFNEDMGIVSSFKTIIKEKDIPLIVEHSYHEANPLYPVSKILSKKDFENIIRRLM